jgi:hypothetical protein
MDRNLFLDQLLRASERCRIFTTQFVTDPLPSAYAFWVELNCSCDDELGPDEVVFPGDVEKYGSRVGLLDAEGVVSVLWRDRMVPEWIDIAVQAADEHTTYFELRCCGRFTSQSELLYYRPTDSAPFGIKVACPPWRSSPVENGEIVKKFSLADSRGEGVSSQQAKQPRFLLFGASRRGR